MKKNRNWISNPRRVIWLGLLALTFLVCACQQEASAPAASEGVTPETVATAILEDEQPAEPTATDTPVPTPEPTATPTVEPTAEPTIEPTSEPPAGLPPEPQEIQFQTSDGATLMGRYYPAAQQGAPVIVLMHWAGGDRNDWNEIAFWLQNRGLSGTSPNLGAAPWLEPSWFPAMPAEKSYAVFTFSFRSYEDDLDGGPEEWLLDAQAGVQAARQLEGIDSSKVVAIGASIGADGAVDGCGANNCLGALSLSPGSYLTIPYTEAVKTMDDAGQTVWCFYAVEDKGSASACQSASGEHYQTAEWPGDPHGMILLSPDIDPSAMQMILDFLAQLGL